MASLTITNLVGGTGTSVEALPLGYLNLETADDGETNDYSRARHWYSTAEHPATVKKYASGETYAYTAENPRAAVFAGTADTNQTKYLDIDLTEDGQFLERTIWPRAAEPTGVPEEDFTWVFTTNGVWADTLVRFTATTEPPEFTDEDRIVVWARDDSESGGSVTLVVSAGYRSRGGRDVAVRHYAATNAVQVDTWYRLTIRNIGDMTDGGSIPGFVAYLDGKPVVVREDDYDIGQKTELAATFFSAASRLLVSERRLFPSVVKNATDASTSMSRLAVSGVGAIDDVSFCSTNELPYVTDRTVMTVKWDFGVASLKYVYRNVTNEIDLTDNANRFADLDLGDVDAAEVEFLATYKTDLTYHRGDWSGTGCAVEDPRTGTVFAYAGGTRNPVATVASMRDLLEISPDGYNTFSAARAAAIKKGGVQTIGLGTNFTPTAKSADKGYASVTYNSDIILDLAGHALTAGGYNAATIQNASGHLRIIDSTGTGTTDNPKGDEKGSVNAYTYDAASNTVGFLYYTQNGKTYLRANAHVAVRNTAMTGRRAPLLQIDAGRFNGMISLESGPQDCLITGGHFYSTNSESFYLAESVTNTKYWAWNAPYWDVSKGYDITYVESDNWKTPTNFVRRYTKDTQCTPLPIPHLDYHDFKGWWMTNQQYVTIGKGTGPTNSPYGNLVLTPHWKSAIEPDSYVWTGLASPDNSWLNPTNWSYEGAWGAPTSATDKVVFPARDGSWPVDLGANAAKPLNWFVYGDLTLSGTNEFRDVVLKGTNTLNGSAELVYAARPPTNLGKFLGSAWKGTVRITNVTDRAELRDIATWGVKGSTVVFNGVYANYTNRTARILPYTLVLEDSPDGAPAWTTDTGFTGNTLDFAYLAGSGALVSTNAFRRPTMQVLRFRDVAKYAGRIYATSKRFVIGTGLPADDTDGTLTVAANARMPMNRDWTFSNVVCNASFYVDGTNGCRICKYLGNADISGCSAARSMNVGGYGGHLVAADGAVTAVTEAATTSSAALPSGSSAASGAAASESAAAAKRDAAASSGAVIGGSSTGSSSGSASASSGADAGAASAAGGGAAAGGSSSSTVSGGTTSSGSTNTVSGAGAATIVRDVIVSDETPSDATPSGASFLAAPVGPVTGNVHFVGSPVIGLNFTNVTLTARVENTKEYWQTCPGWTDSGVRVKMFVSLTKPDGTVVTNALDQKATKSYYQRTTTFEVARGETYVANCWVTTPDQELPIGWAEGVVLTAANATNFIAETAASFTNAALSTGTWFDPYEVAVATDGVIRVDSGLTESTYAGVFFTPTVPEVDRSGYMTGFRATFDDVAPMLPDSEEIYALTLATNGAGATCFAVLDAGQWIYVSTNVFAPATGVEYRVCTRVDETARTFRYIVAPPDGPAVTLATCAVPSGSSAAPGTLLFTGRCSIRAVEGELFDTDLYKLSIAVDPASQAGTNFVAAGVVLDVDYAKTHDTDKTEGEVTVVAKDQMGNVVGTKKVSFSEDRSGPLAVTFEGLAAGAGYTYEASVRVGDGESYDAAREASGAMVLANLRDDWDWIAENGDTFEGTETGTGTWSNTNGVAYATGEEGEKAIAVRTEYDDDAVSFAPSGWPKSDETSLYEIRAYARFEDADALPDAPAASDAWGGYAMTYEADAGSEVDGEYAIAILHDGAWEKVPRATFAPELGVDYAMSAVVDVWNSNVCYYATTTAGVTTCLAALPLPAGIDPMFKTVDVHGDITLSALTGEYYDPNLARDPDGQEYLSFAEAVAARDEHDAIEPLWYCTYELTADKGRFTVYDPNGYLTIVRDKSYKITVKSVGEDTTEYSYTKSDNWLDYADYAEVYDGADGCLHVKAEEGLAYVALLAREGSNFVGRTVVLDRALTNLAAHGWTPIAGFEGVFDGCGYELRGLNDSKYRPVVTNDVGCWGFGLFDGAKNAELRNVVFTEVAIATAALPDDGCVHGDGVGALVGNAYGSLVVSNVWVKSGTLCGADAVGGVLGRADNSAIAPALADFTLLNVTNAASVTVPAGGCLSGTKAAGVLAYADGYAALSVTKCANFGDVTQAADLEDTDTYTAGLLTLAGGTSWNASEYRVTVADCANAGTVKSRVFRLWPADSGEPAGGNVARILCNASDRDVFGAASVAGNDAGGTVDCSLVYNDDRLLTAWPDSNLASAVATYDDEGHYRFFVDANDTAVVSVDPVYHTARMSQARFENDFVNTAGCVNDRITASSEPAALTLDESIVTWEEIVCDRDIEIDLGGHFVEATFYNVAFRATGGATVKVKNGTIFAEEGLWYAVDAGATITFEDVKLSELGGDEIQMNGMTIKAGDLVTLGKTGYDIEIPSASGVTVDDEAKTVSYNGVVVGRFASYYDITSTVEGDVTKVSLALNASAIPTFGASVAPVAPTVQSAPTLMAALLAATPAADGETIPAMALEDGEIKLNALSTYTGLWYGLQYKSTTDGSWNPVADWYPGADGESRRLTAPADDASGFYRVEVTDHAPGE